MKLYRKIRIHLVTRFERRFLNHFLQRPFGMPLVVTGIHDRPPRVGGLNTFMKGGARLLFYLGPLIAPSRQLNAQESKFSMLPRPNTDRVHSAPRFHFGIFVP